MNQFSDRPFAMGSLFGIRSFQINSNGELTGVVHPATWHADTNEAVCNGARWAFAQFGVTAAQATWAFANMSASITGRVLLTKRPKPPVRPPHTIGSIDCTCGFYAYFDRGHNPHHTESQILGIVEGFGVMTVGSRGFRCSKARVRALICEGSDDGLASLLDPRYGDIPRFASIDAALAEFPLTIPEGTPEPSPDDLWESATRYVTFTLTADTTGLSRAIAQMSKDIDRAFTEETPQRRALRLRRERNTGPASRFGLDGHFRR